MTPQQTVCAVGCAGVIYGRWQELRGFWFGWIQLMKTKRARGDDEDAGEVEEEAARDWLRRWQFGKEKSDVLPAAAVWRDCGAGLPLAAQQDTLNIYKLWFSGLPSCCGPSESFLLCQRLCTNPKL